MCEGVHAKLVIRGIDSHGLLAHCGLISVARRLVMIGERYDTGTDAKYHARMNLGVRIRQRLRSITLKVFNGHGYHGSFLLFYV